MLKNYNDKPSVRTDQGWKCSVPHNVCEMHIDTNTCQSKHFHSSD